MVAIKQKTKKGAKEIKKPPIRNKLLDEERKLTHATGESEMVVPIEVSKGEAPTKKMEITVENGFRWDVFLAYVFLWVGGIILYLIAKDDETRWHGFHAIVLGAVCFVMSATLLLLGLAVLMWIYIIYIGWKGGNGERAEFPVLTQFTNDNFERFKKILPQ